MTLDELQKYAKENREMPTNEHHMIAHGVTILAGALANATVDHEGTERLSDAAARDVREIAAGLCLYAAVLGEIYGFSVQGVVEDFIK